MSTHKLVSASLIFVMAACADDPDQQEHAADHPTAETHWGYEGESGPAHWADLDPAWALCATGKRQSPIDITAGVAPHVDALSFDYQASPLDLVNNGHTVQVNYEAGSHLIVRGVSYDLVQFHFHAHSEHRLAGHYAPLEVHLVHRNATGGLAVIGVLIEEGASNAALESVFENLPKQSGEVLRIAGSSFDATELLPEAAESFHYDGSLTTPPCSEGVNWHVLAAPLQASSAQIAKFTALYANDARPLQALEDRPVD
jgi:carbonic anhydrase